MIARLLSQAGEQGWGKIDQFVMEAAKDAAYRLASQELQTELRATSNYVCGYVTFVLSPTSTIKSQKESLYSTVLCSAHAASLVWASPPPLPTPSPLSLQRFLLAKQEPKNILAKPG